MFCLCALALPCAERGSYNCSPTLTLLTFSSLGATAMVGCCGSVKSSGELHRRCVCTRLGETRTPPSPVTTSPSRLSDTGLVVKPSGSLRPPTSPCFVAKLSLQQAGPAA